MKRLAHLLFALAVCVPACKDKSSDPTSNNTRDAGNNSPKAPSASQINQSKPDPQKDGLPTQQEKQSAEEAFAKIGGFESSTDPQPYPVFGMPKETKDEDLKKIPNLPILFGLELAGTQVTDAGMKELANLKNLKYLNVLHTKVTFAGMKELSNLENLTNLYISGTRSVDAKANDAAVKELAKLKNLKVLMISGNTLTESGLKELANLKNLTSLDLYGARLTNAGLKEIANIKSLTSLNISGNNQITDEGLKELANLKNLKSLTMIGTGTNAGKAELIKALPNITVKGP